MYNYNVILTQLGNITNDFSNFLTHNALVVRELKRNFINVICYSSCKRIVTRPLIGSSQLHMQLKLIKTVIWQRFSIPLSIG